MKNLSHQALRALLDALEVLHSEPNPATLTTRTTAAVERIIPCEFVAFDGFGANDKFTAAEWYSDYEIASPQNVAIFAECFNANPQEHPLALEVVAKKRQNAVKISDFVNQSKFRRTTLFNEFFRRVGLNYQMAVALPITKDFTITCGVDRVSKDFSETERSLLTLIAPHLLAAIRAAHDFERLQGEQILLQSAIQAAALNVIILNREEHLRFITDSAKKLLEKYFPDEKTTAGFLPEDLRRYIKSNQFLSEKTKEFYLPPKPLTVKHSAGELQVRLTFDNQAQEIILLLNEQENFFPAEFIKLGLTNRESEILFWITQGKTNLEIAVLCGISWRTVQKHAEHIFDKLGVETRTAAVVSALLKINLIR